LRGKSIAIALLVLVLFSYELFDLWAQPRATAWIVLGYFAAALAVDLVFKGASFCKHVCPIGQFNFIASAMSPTEVQIRDRATCDACRTSDCIKGRVSTTEPLRVVQRGCELGLFLPAKIGNLDCTFCLDCVRACPHENVAVEARLPGVELLDLRRRSGVGRLLRRPDLAALAIVFTFGALLNALAMTAPAVSLERWMAGRLSVSSEAIPLGILFVVGLIVVPVAVLLTAAAVSRGAARAQEQTIRTTAVAYAFALVPLGLGVWLAHYGFHFFTGLLTIVPVTQSAAIDLLGRAALGEPLWRLAGMPPGSVYPIELGFVLLGAAGSIGLVQATSLRDHPARAAAASAPWIGVIMLLAATAVWILNQPMDMRGLGVAG
jgi:hypothetical protein